MGTRRNSPQTGNDRGLAAEGIARLVAVYSRLAQAFSRRDNGADEKSAVLEVAIARRGQRLHNRDRIGASKYERIHTILSRGRA